MNKQPTLADKIDMEVEESLANAVESAARFLGKFSGPNVTNEDKLNIAVAMPKLLSHCFEHFKRFVERFCCEAKDTSERKRAYTAEDAERAALLSNRAASYGHKIAELIDDFGSIMSEVAYEAIAAAVNEKSST